MRILRRALTIRPPQWHDMRTVERDRDDRLIDAVRVRGTMSVEELSREMGVGSSTIRRDLRRLARDRRLVRTYGGATLAARTADPTTRRETRALPEKQRVAVAAAALVQDGQTIVVTSGTTAVEFARQLVDRSELTVITNSLDVAQVLLDCEGIQLVVLGGVVRPRMHSLLGHLTEQACREMRADTLFMGIGAISVEQGLMNDSVPEILTDRALRRMSRSVVVLADASKFEQVAPGFVMELEQVDVLVTDDEAPAGTLDAVRERGVRVIVAPGRGEEAAAAATEATR